MPRSLALPCKFPGCPNLNCEVHKVKREDNRPSSSRRGYNKRWQRIRAMYLRSNPICEDCGHSATEVHHIKPLREGGTNHWENLAPLCKKCHSRRTQRGE